MADSDFWQELASKFRVLDPTRCLRLQWIGFPTERRWEPQIIGTGEACRTIKVQFEALGTRAGIKLGIEFPSTNGLWRWLREVHDSGVNDRPSEGLHTDSIGGRREFIGGTIMHLCEVSADICNKLEASALETEELARRITAKPTEPSDSEIVTENAGCARSTEVDGFLQRCNACSSVRIRRHHIWKSVGHSKGRQFEYWQSCDTKATGEDDLNFSRVMRMKPEDFVEMLRKKGLLAIPR